MRLMMIAVLLLGWSGAVQAQVTSPANVLTSAVTDVIRPNMLRLDASARGLESAMVALCAVPSADALAIAGQQFGKVVAAYGRIAFVRIGPMMEDNRADRLLFWPDRRGIGLKQVQAILAEEDPTVTTLAALQSKSVAVQGLGALEFVLFGTGAEGLSSDGGAFRCAYGQAIAGNIAAIAKDMVTAWYLPGGIADHLQAPDPDYVDYRSQTETLEALVGLVSHGLEGLRDTHLLPFLARDGAPARPKLAAFWRSGATMDFVRANIEGMAELVGRSGVARAVGEKDRGLDNSIAFEFRNATRALDLVTLPIEAAVADDKQAAALGYLVLVTGSLQAMVGEQLPAALGLSVGFSSLDGD
tara:strand:+ start:970 stop:2040 length:1071 start_codon:yes stop_codon:yes gene_type:complete